MSQIPVTAVGKVHSGSDAAEAAGAHAEDAGFRRQDRITVIAEDVLTLVGANDGAGSVTRYSPRVDPCRFPRDDERREDALDHFFGRPPE
ncbi:MAG: hypothetical protein M3277_02050 [Actinomycetota bacterium]|nr:hypothetical protein [Actinomycetota bacterium]